jgi:hypothetical protein
MLLQKHRSSVSEDLAFIFRISCRSHAATVGKLRKSYKEVMAK